MSIDIPRDRHNLDDEIQHRIHKLRFLLEEMGMRVRDVRITEMQHEPQYMDYHTMCDPRRMRVMTEQHVVRWDARWDLEMDQNTAEKLYDAVEKADYFSKRAQEYESKFKMANEDRRMLSNKINKLGRTIRETPGLEEQWDEFVVMLKLAGFDDNLV